MSIHSKAKRDAKKKQRPKTGGGRTAATLQPHAEIIDGDGKVVGGAGLRAGEWVMVLNGREVTSTDSAAMILAMLTHAATLREEAGLPVELRYSTALRDAATAEAQGEGKTLEEQLAMLEAERVERAGFRKNQGADETAH